MPQEGFFEDPTYASPYNFGDVKIMIEFCRAYLSEGSSLRVPKPKDKNASFWRPSRTSSVCASVMVLFPTACPTDEDDEENPRYENRIGLGGCDTMEQAFAAALERDDIPGFKDLFLRMHANGTVQYMTKRVQKAAGLMPSPKKRKKP